MTERLPKPFVPQSFGERVGHARRLLGVREGRDVLAPDLAERVGVTVNAVYAWEAGTLPGKTNLERLSRELGVTPAWLHYGLGPSPAEQPIARGVLSEELVEAVRRRKSTAESDAPAEPQRRAAGGQPHARHQRGKK